MDARTAAHVLTRIAAHLELAGVNRFKVRAYRVAANALRASGADDLAALDRDGELEGIHGLGPATLHVVRDLIAHGESRDLQRMEEATPSGLLSLMEIPGLSRARIRQLHEALHIDTIDGLERAALNGSLESLPRIGPKSVERILLGIARWRARGTNQLAYRMLAEAGGLLAMIDGHPDVDRTTLAGSLRRGCEIADRVVIVAACRRDPTAVADSFTRIPSVSRADRRGSFAAITFVDGVRLDIHCVSEPDEAVATWLATGNGGHTDQVKQRLTARKLAIKGYTLSDADGQRLPVPSESALYEAAGLPLIAPELREGLGEVALAAEGRLPILLELEDIAGVLHCHTDYSDGSASVAEMAEGARARGWRYIGITDHSQAAFYAGGMTRDRALAQHDEIDRVNAEGSGVRVLKGIEADILPDGRLDYDAEFLDHFDFVVGSVHSRFSMSREAMTARVLRALDDPHLTILAHPTGRLLLSRPGYELDLPTVMEKAAAVGVAIELNADPHRLDLDWRELQAGRALAADVAIGPDAHSVGGLDVMALGVTAARKAWLRKQDVLNTREVDEVLAFASRRRHHRRH